MTKVWRRGITCDNAIEQNFLMGEYDLERVAQIRLVKPGRGHYQWEARRYLADCGELLVPSFVPLGSYDVYLDSLYLLCWPQRYILVWVDSLLYSFFHNDPFSRAEGRFGSRNVDLVLLCQYTTSWRHSYRALHVEQRARNSVGLRYGKMRTKTSIGRSFKVIAADGFDKIYRTERYFVKADAYY